MRTRALAALVLVLLCFALLCVHTAQLTERFASSAAAQQHTRTLTVAVTRGKIYARDGSLLVDRTSRLLAAAAPTACPPQKRYANGWSGMPGTVDKRPGMG